MQTTMPCSPPPELLDLIVDDELATLQACCIVSKSWISRTRQHLFAHIRFDPPNRSVELWKRTFPDPSGSLAPYTRTLSFLELYPTTLVNPDIVGWIHSFDRVENLILGFIRDSHGVSLVQLHGFSPALRSVSLAYSTAPFSRIFDFISSFPLLENLALIMISPHTSDTGKWISPSTSPKFTGSLRITGAAPCIIRWLCGLPGGLHFRELHLSHHDDDTLLITELVSKCFNTLESLAISCHRFGAFVTTPPIILRLTVVRDRRRADFARPLKGHEAQGGGVRFRWAASVDQYGYRNYQVKRPSAGHDQIMAYPSRLSRMGGPRPAADPTLDFTLDSPNDFVQ